jgi:Mg2+ and Co2+ transporter CorA
MSTRAKVQDCARRARTHAGVQDKLDAIADAIHEFVDYIELIEHQIKHIEMRLRRMEM